MSFDIRRLLMECLHRWWIILLCAVLGAAAMFGYTYKTYTPQYTTSTLLLINNSRTADYWVDTSNGSVISAPAYVDTYISILQSDLVMDTVADALGGKYTTGQIRSMINVVQVGNLGMMKVYATSTDADEAVRIANVAGETVIDEVQKLVKGTYGHVIDEAKKPGGSKPDYTKKMLIGGAAGAAVVIGLIALQIFMEVRVKSEEDLLGLLDYPLLGRIPEFNDGSGKGYGYRYERSSASSSNRPESSSASKSSGVASRQSISASRSASRPASSVERRSAPGSRTEGRK